MHCGSWLQPHALTSCQVTPQNAGSGCQQAWPAEFPIAALLQAPPAVAHLVQRGRQQLELQLVFLLRVYRAAGLTARRYS